MIEYFLREEGWLAVGLALIIAEMMVSSSYVLLAFGLGSLLNGLLIYAGLAPPVFTRSLLANAAFVAAISFVLVFALRRYFGKTTEADINDY